MGLILYGSYINGLSEKILVSIQMGHFDLARKMLHPASQFWVSCKDCFTILHNERGQERHRNYINGFYERNLNVFRAIWSFWNKNGMVLSSL